MKILQPFQFWFLETFHIQNVNVKDLFLPPSFPSFFLPFFPPIFLPSISFLKGYILRCLKQPSLPSKNPRNIYLCFSLEIGPRDFYLDSILIKTLSHSICGFCSFVQIIFLIDLGLRIPVSLVPLIFRGSEWYLAGFLAMPILKLKST